MPALGDLLSDRDRYRLEHLADPSPNPRLAAAARTAVAASAGSGRIAWASVVMALDRTDSPGEARTVLAGMIEDDQLRNTALACLGSLTGDPGAVPGVS
jgi:hypothetical protein